MQLLKPFGVALAIATSVQACIRIHTVSFNNPLVGDAMRVQIWDNDDFYELQRQQVSPGEGNADKHWGFQFGGGHYVEVWDNGKAGRVALQNGWQANFRLRETELTRECVLEGENFCRVNALVVESCLDDYFGNCDGYSCGLCDAQDCPR